MGVGWRPEVCSCVRIHLVDPFWHADHASFGTVCPDGYGIDCTYLRHTFLFVPRILADWRSGFPVQYLSGGSIYLASASITRRIALWWFYGSSRPRWAPPCEIRDRESSLVSDHFDVIGSSLTLWRACGRCEHCRRSGARTTCAASCDGSYAHGKLGSEHGYRKGSKGVDDA